MGNRGIIHDPSQHILRPFKLKAWITCQLTFRDRKRQVMAPNRYTELFFLDEATAFAAGHRPCFECRREAANAFKAFWLKGNPAYHFDAKTPIGRIDDLLHAERIDREKNKVTYEEDRRNLPNGVFILFNKNPYLVLDGLFYLWSPSGYEKGTDLLGERFTVLTPRSIVDAFRAGYVPQMNVVEA
jgi:hypothetical protein